MPAPRRNAGDLEYLNLSSAEYLKNVSRGNMALLAVVLLALVPRLVLAF